MAPRTRSRFKRPSTCASRGRRADRLIVGSGQYGNVELSPEAAAYLQRRKCRVVLLPTPEAIDARNQTEGGAIGLFHVTC